MADILPLFAPTDDAGPRAELRSVSATVTFMLAGNAHVTFQSRETGRRFTYSIQKAPPRSGVTGPSHFVGLLTGPDHYDYLGCIYDRRMYAHGRKSRISTNAQSAVAFAWVWRLLSANRPHRDLAVYHEGRCGRCGRRLTTPESIEIGLGPTCAGKQS